MSEQLVGITQHTTDTPGFRAVTKQRFSDFIVHEIGLDGNISSSASIENDSDPLVGNREPGCGLMLIVHSSTELRSCDLAEILPDDFLDR